MTKVKVTENQQLRQRIRELERALEDERNKFPLEKLETWILAKLDKLEDELTEKIWQEANSI